AGHSGKNLRGAVPFFRGWLLSNTRLADENRATAGSVLGRSGGLIRPSDLDGRHVGVTHVHLVIRDDPAPLQRLRQAFRFPELPHERNADDARARLEPDSDLQPGVSRNLHVLFPFGITGKAWFTVAGVARCGGPALGA